MYGEDSFLDSFMEDQINGGYGSSFDTYHDGEYYPYPEYNYAPEPWSDWDEAEFERGFNEAHARSEEMSDEELDAYYAQFGI